MTTSRPAAWRWRRSRMRHHIYNYGPEVGIQAGYVMRLDQPKHLNVVARKFAVAWSARCNGNDKEFNTLREAKAWTVKRAGR